MSTSAADRRSPLGLFPGKLAPLPDALAADAGREAAQIQWVSMT